MIEHLLAGLVMLSPAAADTTPRDLGRLRLAVPRSASIAPNTVHAYRVFLRKGEAARVVVEAPGLDVGVAVRAPNGAPIAVPNTPTVVVVAEQPGDYQLVVRLLWAATGGKYRVTLREHAPAARRHRLAFDAQSSYSRALTLRSQAPRQVLQLADSAMRLAREAHDSVIVSRSLYLIGEAKGHLGDFRAAVDVWTEVIGIAARLRDGGMQGSTLATRGRLYLRLGERGKAEADLRRATPLLEKAGDQYAAAIADGTLAELVLQSGQIQEALRLYERLLAMTRRTGDHLREGVTLNDLAIAYQRGGDLARARTLFAEALQLIRRYGDARNVAITLHNLGALHLALDDTERAIALFNESLQLRAQIDPYGRAVTLGQLGRAYAEAGRPDLARERLEQALALRAEDDAAGRAYVLARLGAVYAGSGDRAAALDVYAQAVALHRRARQRLGEADALYGMARVLLAEGRLADAEARIDETLQLVESVRWNIGSRNLRAYFVGSVHDYYETKIAILMAMHRRSPAEGVDARALEASERARARTLVEFLADARAGGARSAAAASLTEKRRELGDLLAIKGEQQVRLTSRVRSPADEAALATEIEELSRRYASVELEIANEGTLAGKALPPDTPPLTVAKLQELLDEDTMLLEFALSEERSYAWIVTRHSLASFELPARREVEPAVRALHERWSIAQSEIDVDTATARLARAASEMLLGPLKAHLVKRRVLVVPDGALSLIPFGALFAGDAALLDRHEVVELPSAGALSALRGIRERRAFQPKTLALLADPVYDAGDSRIPGPGARARVGSVSGEPGLQLARLPFSRIEAKSILGLVPPARRFEALGFQANRQHALRMDLSGFRIVHFATHAVANRAHPSLSGIVLSLVDSSGRDQPGLVSLLDVAHLRLNAELVVLSACHTASGDVLPGEGAMSLARAFMHAGATAVVASLWKVDDAATAELMRRFYVGMLGPLKLPPAMALRRAQLEVRAMPRWSDPHFWAAFVLLGE